MTWKRNFLSLVFVGTLLVVFIFMSGRGDEFIAGPNIRMRTEDTAPLPHIYNSNRLTNTDYIARYSLHSSSIHRTNLSLQSQSLYRNSPHQDIPSRPATTATPTREWAHLTNRTSSEDARTIPVNPELPQGRSVDHNHSDGHHPQYHEHVNGKYRKPAAGPGGPSVYRKIDRTLQPIEGPKPLSETYSRVFQWNDRDPDGWKTLPLSVGKPGEKNERIIFNRVGKCGSRSVINLIRDLAQRNHFSLISSIVYNKTHIPGDWEEHLVSVLDEVQTPYLFQRHLHYVNFRRHNASEVVYINVIRDPISRMVSQYYFARFGDGQSRVPTNSSKRTEEEINETIDDCVRNNHRDCIDHRAFYIIPFFCGNLKRCTKPSRWALQRAIYNIQKHFIVVGILEEFDLTLRMLERMLPRFFDGATELYHTAEIQDNISRTTTSRKIPPSNETVAILRERMEYEYVFYNFIKDRLHKQAEILGS